MGEVYEYSGFQTVIGRGGDLVHLAQDFGRIEVDGVGLIVDIGEADTGQGNPATLGGAIVAFAEVDHEIGGLGVDQEFGGQAHDAPGGVLVLGGQHLVGIADSLPAGLADLVLAGLERAEDRDGGVDASVDHVVSPYWDFEPARGQS